MASEKVMAIVEELKVLTVLELSELVKAVEEEFGVSAAAGADRSGILRIRLVQRKLCLFQIFRQSKLHLEFQVNQSIVIHLLRLSYSVQPIPETCPGAQPYAFQS